MILAGACVLCMLATASHAVANLYVSLNGNDSWSGTLDTPSGDDGPLRTLAGARDAIRALKASNGGVLPGALDVQLRGGTYRLLDPVIFSYEDSGTFSAPITWRSYPGESAVISGGKVINGWTVEGNLWKKTLPDVLNQGWRFSVLFVDGELRLPARAPNGEDDPADLDGDGFYNTQGAVPGEAEAFYVDPGEIVPVRNADDALYQVVHHWDTSFHRVLERDGDAGLVRFYDIKPSTVEPEHTAFFGETQRYAIYHAWEALDAPGEWWLDSADGTLYYYPFPDESPATTQVVAPFAETLLRFQSTQTKPIGYVTLDGLTFAHTNYIFGPDVPRPGNYGLGQAQALVQLPGAVEFTKVSNSTVTRCTFSQLAAHGLLLLSACTNDTVRQNHFTQLGGTAIDVGRDFAVGTSDNTVDNNWIHDGGQWFLGAVGLRIGASSRNEVTHNEISDYPYCGISAGWRVGYGPTVARDNLIRLNHVHHIGEGILSDMGAIYCVGEAPGTRVTENLCHDVSVYDRGYGGWGIYLDEGSSELTVEKNVVYATDDGAFHLHYGRDNVITNNIFAWSREAQLFRTREEYTYAKSFDFTRNIVYFNNDTLLAGAWQDGKTFFDNNCYWDTSAFDITFPFGMFADWQATGQDIHSIIADPLFTDAEHYDFTLDPASPAITQLGFVPVDVRTAGLYGDPEWVAGPAGIIRAVTPLPKPPEGTTYAYDFEAVAAGTLPETWQAYEDPDNEFVRVTGDRAHRGTHSMLLRDQPGLPYPWLPVAFIKPNYRVGVGAMRMWLYMDEAAVFVFEWRDNEVPPYKIGANLAIGPWGMTVNSTIIGDLARNQWVYVEASAAVGDAAAGTFDLTTWDAEQGWLHYPDLPFVDADFARLAWGGFVSYDEVTSDIYIDDFELFAPESTGADADNDGVFDVEDGVLDFDGDGLSNRRDNDSDNDGIPDGQEYYHDDATNDFDGDGMRNYLDLDSDGDTLTDKLETADDPDEDGIPSFLDDDSDGNGIPDSIEGSADPDHDTLGNSRDLDDDGDGISDIEEGTGDPDEDGTPNYRDTDSDGDGIDDRVETVSDPDEDGIPSYLDDDSDGNGVLDSAEGLGDADADGMQDSIDLDDDGNGINDVDEIAGDLDDDGTDNYRDLDDDDDGIDDVDELTSDTDLDGEPDYRDTDSDADGIDDSDEGMADPDNDGLPNAIDPDSDGDGIDDIHEGAGDTDGDGTPDYLDTDRDGDGIDDAPLSIAAPPQAATLYVGASYTLSVTTAGGLGLPAYVWKKDGATLGAASLATYTIATADFDAAGEYTVTVTDVTGSVTSPAAIILVTEPSTEGYHTADSSGDWRINLAELLRVIQFFNAGGLQCGEGTEDGYMVGLGAQDCPTHDSDYSPADWHIGLSEILRVIQFFNSPSSAYHAQPGTEDGFAPGAG